MRPWLSRNRILEIVMSGNSSSSKPRTSPIERCDVFGSAIGTLEQDEAKLADLQLVAVAQEGAIDSLLVDVRAVERSFVAHDVSVVGSLDGDVAPRHRDVVEHDVGI